jgi:hypothetical protein
VALIVPSPVVKQEEDFVLFIQVGREQGIDRCRPTMAGPNFHIGLILPIVSGRLQAYPQRRTRPPLRRADIGHALLA